MQVLLKKLFQLLLKNYQLLKLLVINLKILHTNRSISFKIKYLILFFCNQTCSLETDQIYMRQYRARVKMIISWNIDGKNGQKFTIFHHTIYLEQFCTPFKIGIGVVASICPTLTSPLATALILPLSFHWPFTRCN